MEWKQYSKTSRARQAETGARRNGILGCVIIALRATTNPSARRIARARFETAPCRLASGFARPADKSPFQPFGFRRPAGHESPPSRCTKTPTAWASLKGDISSVGSWRVLWQNPHSQRLRIASAARFFVCVRVPRRRFSCPADGAPAGAAVATRLARLCLKPCRGDTAAVAVRQRAVRRLSWSRASAIQYPITRAAPAVKAAAANRASCAGMRRRCISPIRPARA